MKDSGKRVVLSLSGGLDSTCLLFDLLKTGYSVECINFQYGSKHNLRERAFAISSAFASNTTLISINMDFMAKLFKSSLLLTGETIPKGHYAEPNMKKTVVPFRNAIMLSIAGGYAASIGANFVAAGTHHGDHTIYPDCRPEFMEAMRDTFRTGLWEDIRLLTPYTWFDKGDIAIRGYEAKAPIFRTYSCYTGEEIHCGVCGACTERKEAFKKLYEKHGVKDETDYKQ
jgi:7-cyano-7-deazaguanine synthase